MEIFNAGSFIWYGVGAFAFFAVLALILKPRI